MNRHIINLSIIKNSYLKSKKTNLLNGIFLSIVSIND